MRLTKRTTLFALTAVLALPSCLPVAQTKKKDTLIDVTALDRATSPCDDFYQFACGGWLKSFQLPADETSYTRSFDSIYQRNREINRTILEAYARGDYSLPAKHAKKLGQFYAACMDTSRIEKETPAVVSQALGEIEAVSAKPELAALVAKLHLQGTNVFFSFNPDSDAKDSNREIGEFGQGGMGLPNNTYYLDENNAEARAKYLEHVQKMLILSGLDAPQAKAGASRVFAIENTLAQSALRPEDMNDPRTLYHPLQLAELRQALPAFDVDAYLAGLGLSPLTYVNVMEPKFLQAVNQVIASTPLEDLKLYLKWQTIKGLAPRLSQAFRQEAFDFDEAYLNGAKKMSERWKQCVSHTSRAMGEALGEAYVNKTFGADGKVRSQEMIDAIEAAFLENLDSVQWLDADTRAKAAAKAHQIISKIGYPEKFRAYDELAVGDSFVANAYEAKVFEARYQLGLIGKPVDKSAWGMTPQMVNAYYNPNWNEIVFPAGILQSPFFSKEASDGANLGAIGMVMGHELTHGFDSSGRRFDGDGNLVDWWTETASHAFDERAQCVVNQYNHYEVVPGVFINGKQTLTENIADLGGVKLAYRAYQKLAAKRLRSAPVAGFTEEQQFFLSFAQGWCTAQTPEYAKMLAQTDTHSDARYRVNGSLVNTPEFARTFGCTAGKPMAPVNRCALW